MSGYSSQFYRQRSGLSRRSAEVVVPMLRSLFAPKSVIDIGCGTGTWLSVFEQAGVSEFLGIDGEFVDRDQLEIDDRHFLAANLETPIELDRRFDLALCLEVAEHLHPDSAKPLTRFLSGLAPVVVFSAAIPFQGGMKHLNEQWPRYWADLFANNGFSAFDLLRTQLWTDDRVAWWYRQNILIFANEDAQALHPALAAKPSTPPDLVHPDLYLGTVRRGSWSGLLDHTARAAARRITPSASRRMIRKAVTRVRGPDER